VSDPVITTAAQITAAWLEQALRRSNALCSGGLEAFELEDEAAAWSRNVRLRPHYKAGSTGTLPGALFLKMCGSDAFGPSEVEYYGRDYLGLDDAPLVRCYDARYQEHPRAYHVLLDDLSATHTDCRDLDVTAEFVGTLADSVAALHAHRRTVQQLEAIGASLPRAASIERYLAHIRRGLEPLLTIGGADVRLHWRPLLQEIFAYHPALMAARCTDPNGLCLVHGDINPTNILAPLAWPGRVYLIDRQPFDWSLTVWLGVSDLAYLMCCFWPETVRRTYELPLLHRYHAGLQRRGVDGYGWEQLWADYRLSAVQAAYVAVEWCVLEPDRERMRWLWTAQLARAMAAIEDLRCGELWAP
jgi:hypothetical protein